MIVRWTGLGKPRKKIRKTLLGRLLERAGFLPPMYTWASDWDNPDNWEVADPPSGERRVPKDGDTVVFPPGKL